MECHTTGVKSPIYLVNVRPFDVSNRNYQSISLASTKSVSLSRRIVSVEVKQVPRKNDMQKPGKGTNYKHAVLVEDDAQRLVEYTPSRCFRYTCLMAATRFHQSVSHPPTPRGSMDFKHSVFRFLRLAFTACSFF